MKPIQIRTCRLPTADRSALVLPLPRWRDGLAPQMSPFEQTPSSNDTLLPTPIPHTRGGGVLWPAFVFFDGKASWWTAGGLKFIK